MPKCLQCGEVRPVLASAAMDVCSISCHHSISRASWLYEVPPKIFDEGYQYRCWLFSKKYGVKITAEELFHPNKLIRDRATLEWKYQEESF